MFNLYNSNGDQVLGPGSFPLIAIRRYLPAGISIISDSGFVCAGMSGSELRRGVVFISTKNASGAQTVQLSIPAEVVIYLRAKNNIAPSGGFGMELYDSDGSIAFSTASEHMFIHSSSNLLPSHTEPLNDGYIYAITLSNLVGLCWQQGQQPWFGINLYGIRGSSGNLAIGSVSWSRTPIPCGEVQFKVAPFAISIIRLRRTL